MAVPNDRTVAQLVETTKRELSGLHVSVWNRLNAAVTAESTTLTFVNNTPRLAASSTIEIDDEVMVVVETNRDSKQCTVLRGMFGTTAAAHAINAVAEFNPRFARTALRDHMLAEVQSWPTSLYRVLDRRVTVEADGRTVNIGLVDQHFLRPLRLYRLATTTHPLRGLPFSWRSGFSSTLRASGHDLKLESLSVSAGEELELVYAAAFDVDSWADGRRLAEHCGVPTSLFDALRYGTMARALEGKEVLRTDTQAADTSAHRDQVRPLQAFQTAQGFRALADARIASESARLIDRYGIGEQ